MQADPLLITMAVGSLAIGLGLYIWLVTGRVKDHFAATNLISWLLIALFPVLLIFGFFRDSSSDFSVAGAKFGGAIAAFIFLWWFGTRSGLTAAKLDEQNARIGKLQEQIARQDRANSPPSKLNPAQSVRFKMKNSKKIICLFTGNIADLDKADIWASSENTNMQMARFYDRSVSGTIRYWGAKKDQFGTVLEDSIADELEEKLEGRQSVQPRTIVVTSAGELTERKNVKLIFHVAAVQGQPGIGYVPIQDIHNCVADTLRRAEAGDEARKLNCKSVALPLFGTGTARGNLKESVKSLIECAVTHLDQNPSAAIEVVYFLTWLDVERDAAQAVLEEDKRVVLAR